RGQQLAAVLSGANMNFDRLRFVAERAELGEGREALLAVTIPEQPGAFRAFCAALGGRWNISLFHYRNHGADFGRVLAAFEVPDDDRTDFEAFLSGLGYRFQLDEGNDAYRRFLGHA